MNMFVLKVSRLIKMLQNGSLYFSKENISVEDFCLNFNSTNMEIKYYDIDDQTEINIVTLMGKKLKENLIENKIK